MKTLITGSTGFIGQVVATQLQHKVCVLRKGSTHHFADIFEIDLLGLETDWQGAFSDITSIIHLAGIASSEGLIDDEYQTVNTKATIKLAQEAAAEGVKRFVFVSSIRVNGKQTYDVPFNCMSEPGAHNAYSNSKYDAELGLKRIADETGMELVIVRPTLVYGADAKGNFGSLVNLISKIFFLPFGLTKNKRSFISVQNLADLLITCTNHPNAAGHTFLASEGEAISIKDFTNAIAKGLGKKLIQIPVPVSIMKFLASLIGKSSMADQLLGNLEVDSSNIQEVLGWAPKYTMAESMSLLNSRNKSND